MAAGTASVLSCLRLWEYADNYIFEPFEENSPSLPVLKVDRDGGDLRLDADESTAIPSASDGVVAKRTRTVYGILGMLRLLAGPYLIVLTGRQGVGVFRESAVWRVTGMDILPCFTSTKHLSASQKRDEENFVQMLHMISEVHGLFFSYSADITISAQKLATALKNDEWKLQPLWKRAEPRFFWNRHLAQAFIESRGLDAFILPVMQGSFQSFPLEVKGKNIEITLIARRCCRRIGTRMWRRGADIDGNVANFMETEQILSVDGSLAAYLQVRGSIPVFWEQIVDLKYKPNITPINSDESQKVTERHFRDLLNSYGAPIVIVDLVNQSGGESLLGAAYSAGVQSLANDEIRYVAFDFHKECGEARYDRLYDLFQSISDSVTKQRQFLAKATGEKLEEQKGIVRTNCVDCLDRTNVFQSVIARKVLEKQLYLLSVFEEDEPISKHKSFDLKYKTLWGNHGDDISIQYTGTPALKRDFVRTGSRTIRGLADDGINSLVRYYLNNFRDGLRQDSLDLLMGSYVVNESEPSPFALEGLERFADAVFERLINSGVLSEMLNWRPYGNMVTLECFGCHDRPRPHPFREELARDVLFKAEFPCGNPDEVADAEWARKMLAIGLLARALLRLIHLVACLDKKFLHPTQEKKMVVALGRLRSDNVQWRSDRRAVLKLKGRYPDSRVDRGVVGQLDIRQPLNPVLLAGADESAKGNVCGLMRPLRLAIGLRVAS
ncbi:hypothetical protein CBR_g32128 [Chara braunii]|uniref:SAC domain-containing protein n=1 Tax=Chara braunii TaxID=69332 RepID=A0A388JMP8_CHABU|nr:hypothetical protein CBR_g32128 [Chara braunii]|eukprot:GBG59110.1 hypothetical protein CBR_g32128 [Chara braunii]